MKTIVKKELQIETRRHDFDNEFAYIEIWHNNQLKDCYFVEKEFLWPDGTLKAGGKKYFLGRVPENPEKEIKCVNYKNFDHFKELYCLGENGEVVNIMHL